MVRISTDITELRRIEKELVRNEAMEQFFNMRAGQIIGKTDADLFRPEQVDEIEQIDRQVIASIISLRKSVEKNSRLKEVLNELENKIYSMALVHQKLYQSQNLSKIDVEEYIKDLANLILNSFQQPGRSITVNFDVKPIHCLIDTVVPLGIVINELLTNAIKYAFLGRRTGNISIAADNNDKDELVVEISDDGIGMPEELDVERTGSFYYGLYERQQHGRGTNNSQFEADQ